MEMFLSDFRLVVLLVILEFLQLFVWNLHPCIEFVFLVTRSETSCQPVSQVFVWSSSRSVSWDVRTEK